MNKVVSIELLHTTFLANPATKQYTIQIKVTIPGGIKIITVPPNFFTDASKKIYEVEAAGYTPLGDAPPTRATKEDDHR